MSRINTYLFVTLSGDGAERNVYALRGLSLADATHDAVKLYTGMKYPEQSEIEDAWVVNRDEYEQNPNCAECADAVNYFTRPLKWADAVGVPSLEYTGGGWWIAIVYVTEHIYYAVDNEYEQLFMYDDMDENDGDGFCYEDLIGDRDLTEEEQRIHKRLLNMLKENGHLYGGEE